jgi:hypothetical protein
MPAHKCRDVSIPEASDRNEKVLVPEGIDEGFTLRRLESIDRHSTD